MCCGLRSDRPGRSGRLPRIEYGNCRVLLFLFTRKELQGELPVLDVCVVPNQVSFVIGKRSTSHASRLDRDLLQRKCMHDQYILRSKEQNLIPIFKMPVPHAATISIRVSISTKQSIRSCGSADGTHF